MPTFVRFGLKIIDADKVTAAGRDAAGGAFVLTGAMHEHQFAGAEAEAVWRYFRGRSDDGMGGPVALAGEHDGGTPATDAASRRAASSTADDRDMEWAKAVKAWADADAMKDDGFGVRLDAPPADPAGVAAAMDRVASDAFQNGVEYQQRREREQLGQEKERAKSQGATKV